VLDELDVEDEELVDEDELVELDDPPLEVLVLDPPDEVEVEPPLEVDETTMLPLEPPPPPKNPPPKNPPPPKPPDPPITARPELPLPLIVGWGGRGMGVPCVVTVTVCGTQAVVVLTTLLRVV